MKKNDLYLITLRISVLIISCSGMQFLMLNLKGSVSNLLTT